MTFNKYRTFPLRKINPQEINNIINDLNNGIEKVFVIITSEQNDPMGAFTYNWYSQDFTIESLKNNNDITGDLYFVCCSCNNKENNIPLKDETKLSDLCKSCNRIHLLTSRFSPQASLLNNNIISF